MNKSLSHLPENKQLELAEITSVIRQQLPEAKLILLFGSYARNDWVETHEIDDDYQSDYDILVLVEGKYRNKTITFESKLSRVVNDMIRTAIPVSVLVNDIDFVNQQLQKAQYFFKDIKQDGIVLYDSGELKLSKSVKLSGKQRQNLAQDYYDRFFDKATSFLKNYKFSLKEKDLLVAAFLLHQATENLFATILLVYSHYKPKEHDLEKLYKMTKMVEPQFNDVIPLHTKQNQQLFELLRTAYVDARYSPSYTINQAQLETLAQWVENLKHLTLTSCQERIASYFSE
jgi:predicted nucleotidyltransferase/HEPN domain-containing protein